jgi:hypothetical protein
MIRAARRPCGTPGTSCGPRSRCVPLAVLANHGLGRFFAFGFFGGPVAGEPAEDVRSTIDCARRKRLRDHDMGPMHRQPC